MKYYISRNKGSAWGVHPSEADAIHRQRERNEEHDLLVLVEAPLILEPGEALDVAKWLTSKPLYAGKTPNEDPDPVPIKAAELITSQNEEITRLKSGFEKAISGPITDAALISEQAENLAVKLETRPFFIANKGLGNQTSDAPAYAARVLRAQDMEITRLRSALLSEVIACLPQAFLRPVDDVHEAKMNDDENDGFSP